MACQNVRPRADTGSDAIRTPQTVMSHAPQEQLLGAWRNHEQAGLRAHRIDRGVEVRTPTFPSVCATKKRGQTELSGCVAPEGATRGVLSVYRCGGSQGLRLSPDLVPVSLAKRAPAHGLTSAPRSVAEAPRPSPCMACAPPLASGGLPNNPCEPLRLARGRWVQYASRWWVARRCARNGWGTSPSALRSLALDQVKLCWTIC